MSEKVVKELVSDLALTLRTVRYNRPSGDINHYLESLILNLRSRTPKSVDNALSALAQYERTGELLDALQGDNEYAHYAQSIAELVAANPRTYEMILDLAAEGPDQSIQAFRLFDVAQRDLIALIKHVGCEEIFTTLADPHPHDYSPDLIHRLQQKLLDLVEAALDDPEACEYITSKAWGDGVDVLLETLRQTTDRFGPRLERLAARSFDAQMSGGAPGQAPPPAASMMIR